MDIVFKDLNFYNQVNSYIYNLKLLIFTKDFTNMVIFHNVTYTYGHSVMDL